MSDDDDDDDGGGGDCDGDGDGDDGDGDGADGDGDDGDCDGDCDGDGDDGDDGDGDGDGDGGDDDDDDFDFDFGFGFGFDFDFGTLPQQKPAHLGFGTSGKRVVERCGWNSVRLSYFQLKHFIFRTSFCCAADCMLPAVRANSRKSERTVPQSVGRTMRRKLGMLQSNSSPRRTKLRWACSTSSKGVLASTNKVISCNSGQIWISEFEDT